MSDPRLYFGGWADWLLFDGVWDDDGLWLSPVRFVPNFSDWVFFSEVWDDQGVWLNSPPLIDQPFPEETSPLPADRVPRLLPSNATFGERQIEQVQSRIGAVPVPLASLWNPATCPAHLLPWLAWAFSVDYWEPTWPEATKRAVIASSIAVHRRKGTRASVEAALAAAGYATAEIIERFPGALHGGTITYDGSEDHGPSDHWAEYRVTLTQPITNAQADETRAILLKVAPVRCHLKTLTYVETALTYNGAVFHDGVYNHGSA